MNEQRRPAAFDLDERDPDNAHRHRENRAVTDIEFESNEAFDETEPVPRTFLPSSRHIRWFTIFASTLAALALLWAGLAVAQLIDDLFARSEILGWIAAAIAGIAAFS